MNAFKARKSKAKRDTSSDESRGVKSGTFVGICPLCGFSSTLRVDEDVEKISIVCTSCNQIIFYLNKIRTPSYERNLDDLIDMGIDEPYVYKSYRREDS